MSKPTTTRQTKTPRARAQEALDVATRLVSRLEVKAERLRIELAGIERLYLSKHPDLVDRQLVHVAGSCATRRRGGRCGMSNHVDATFYAQVEPQWGWAPSGNDKPLKGAKAVALTQQKPARQKGGTVLVKLTIRLPHGAFLPLRPEAIVVIPEDMTVTEPLEVVAEDPS